MSLHETYVVVNFGENGTRAVPITSKMDETDECLLCVQLGLRPSICSTIHSFQGRTVVKEYVISLDTYFECHGILYTALSRVRDRGQLYFYRHDSQQSLHNVVDAAFLLDVETYSREGEGYSDEFEI